MKNTIGKLIAAILGIPLVLLAVGLSLDSIRPMPDNVILYVDERSGEYYPANGTLERSNMRKMTAAEAHTKKYRPNSKDNKAMTFFEEQGSLTRRLMVELGVLKSKQPKWNTDGSWNY